MRNLSISFVVPCFCTDKSQLMRCLRSIISLGDDFEWEVRLIDDGTPHSQVESWLKELGDGRIYYHYQENEGLGGARNKGIELSTKEYIQFVDSDDYLFRDAYLYCAGILDRYSPDLLIFGYRKVYSDGVEECVAGKCGRLLRYKDGTEYMLKKSLFAAACMYVVKRDVIGNKRFLHHIFHEDEEFTPRLLLDCGEMIVTDAAPYAYYQRPDSIIGRRDAAHVDRRFKDLLRVICSLRAGIAQQDKRKSDALTRRVDQLGEAFVYDLIRFSPDAAFLERWLDELRANGIFPVACKRYNMKYVIFYCLTNKRWKVRAIYNLNKKIGII